MNRQIIIVHGITAVERGDKESIDRKAEVRHNVHTDPRLFDILKVDSCVILTGLLYESVGSEIHPTPLHSLLEYADVVYTSSVDCDGCGVNKAQLEFESEKTCVHCARQKNTILPPEMIVPGTMSVKQIEDEYEVLIQANMPGMSKKKKGTVLVDIIRDIVNDIMETTMGPFRYKLELIAPRSVSSDVLQSVGMKTVTWK